jgi:hypothetical protein
MHQKQPCVCGAIELSSDDILFILSCIESSERQNLKELGGKALYVRLVQKYVNLVTDRIEPASKLKHQASNARGSTLSRLYYRNNGAQPEYAGAGSPAAVRAHRIGMHGLNRRSRNHSSNPSRTIGNSHI